MSDKIKEIVKDMAKLTIMSGKINPAQERTLKMYPMIIFDGVKLARIDYDLTYKRTDETGVEHNSLIRFDLTVNEDQRNIEKKFEYLEMAVRELFWEDVSVQITLNGKLAYLTGAKE